MKSVIVAIVSSVLIGYTIFITLFLLNYIYEIQCIEENENEHQQQKIERAYDYEGFKFTSWLTKFLIVTIFYFKYQLL